MKAIMRVFTIFVVLLGAAPGVAPAADDRVATGSQVVSNLDAVRAPGFYG